MEHTWAWAGLNTAGWTPCEFIIGVCCCGMPVAPPGQGAMVPMGLPLFWLGLDDGIEEIFAVGCPMGPGVGLMGRSFKLYHKTRV